MGRHPVAQGFRCGTLGLVHVRTEGVTSRATSGPNGVRVLLAAEEPLHGHALKLLLESSGFQTLYIERLSRARRILGSHLKEVLLWFGDYLDRESLEDAREIRHAHPDLGLCVLANGADPDALRGLVSDRAEGLAVLLRGNRPEVGELLDAIDRAVDGKATVEPCLLERLLASPRCAGLEWLSDGEREILELIALGLRNREIGRRLCKSEKTVEKRVGRLFSKLGLDPKENQHLDRRVMAARIFLSEQLLADANGDGFDERRPESTAVSG